MSPHEYYLENRDTIIKKVKAYAATHRKELSEKARARYLRTSDEAKARAAAWAKANPEKRKEIRARWWQKNKAARAVHKSRRRAREASVVRDLTTAEWKVILGLSPSCFYCRQAFGVKRIATMDHVVPLSKNGGHTKYNVVAACKSCNFAKHDRDISEFIHSKKAL